MIKIQNFIINGDNVVLILVLIVLFVKLYVLVYNLIFVSGVEEHDMDSVMLNSHNVILEI